VAKHAGLPITKNPCPQINAELPLVATQFYFSSHKKKKKKNAFGLMLISAIFHVLE
jgi:hypothetical protein